MMQFSPPMVIFISNWEGEGDGDKKKPGLQPYMCIAGYWTIGFGRVIFHQGRALRYEADRELANKLYPAVTRAQAIEMLKEDLVKTRDAVLECLAGANVKQAEFDAMGSLCFNIGKKNFAKSSMLRYHKRGLTKPTNADTPAFRRMSQNRSLPGNAPDQFPAWSYINGGQTWSQGLFNRRVEERRWYLKA